MGKKSKRPRTCDYVVAILDLMADLEFRGGNRLAHPLRTIGLPLPTAKQTAKIWRCLPLWWPSVQIRFHDHGVVLVW